MTNERELAAVVAHGLLNTTAVLASSAHTLRSHADRLTDDDRLLLTTALVTHSALLAEGLNVLLHHCSDQFGDAATVIALTASTIAAVPDADLPMVLDGIVNRVKILSTGLEALVRGLPHEVLALLDSLRH